jgi:hypothetical protein
LASICLKCLEKDPARRYPSAEKLAADLESWLKGEPPEVEPWWQWLWRQFRSPCRLDRPREWARVFWYLAAWRVFWHGVMALLLLTLGPATAWYWAWFIGLHVGTWLPVGWLLRSESRLNPIERGALLSWYVAEGRRSWGRFYAVGLGYFVAAPLLSFCGLLAPVAYALVVGCAMLSLAYGFWCVAKQQAALLLEIVDD